MRDFQAILSNKQHPEYGEITVPFPIPDNRYDRIIELLEALEIGGTVKRDCLVDEIMGCYPILERLENAEVNVDELDYLARRLDSLDRHEIAKFHAMAYCRDIAGMTDLINLTFCCQEATVIENFRDLGKVGKERFMDVNAATVEDLKYIDFQRVAMKLFSDESGQITPYGVVYDNGMQLEPLYDGRNFPEYHDRDSLLDLELSDGPEREDAATVWLDLPLPAGRIQRAMARAGIGVSETRLQLVTSALPEALLAALELTPENLGSLNELCLAIRNLDKAGRETLGAAVQLAKPESIQEVRNLVGQLDQFCFIPGVSDAAEYGRAMITSGSYIYDPELEEFYDYAGFGAWRISEEQGAFVPSGYIRYLGDRDLRELIRPDINDESQISLSQY